ncbi:hypothetical protein [Leuconostoc inhae]|uniref:hypothetical protein n=1 Tax=Leuconostoc inhae TaxID=178001 RepID=UPI001C7D4CD3|nr:hypothetical protein [Leuconostoc inhae]
MKRHFLAFTAPIKKLVINTKLNIVVHAAFIILTVILILGDTGIVGKIRVVEQNYTIALVFYALFISLQDKS